MRRLSLAVLLAVLFVAGAAVYAEKDKSSKSSSSTKELTPAEKAAKCKKTAEILTKKASQWEAKGKKSKAERLKKLAEVQTKMAEAYEKNDTAAIEAADAEWKELTSKSKGKKTRKRSRKSKKSSEE
ncbi:MAG: hypothetical protein WC082_02445 [Victivallales bacterium]